SEFGGPSLLPVSWGDSRGQSLMLPVPRGGGQPFPRNYWTMQPVQSIEWAAATELTNSQAMSTPRSWSPVPDRSFRGSFVSIEPPQRGSGILSERVIRRAAGQGLEELAGLGRADGFKRFQGAENAQALGGPAM